MARTLVWVHSRLRRTYFTIEGDISPSLADPALLSVVGVVDGQFTGFITKKEGISSTERTGPGFSAFKASAGRPAKRTRPLTSYPASQSRVLPTESRSWSRDSPTSHEVNHVIHRTRRSVVRSLHSRLMWLQFLVPEIHLQRTGTDFSATGFNRPVTSRLLWYKERTRPGRASPRSSSRDSPTRSRSWSSYPISQSRCQSDQQAGHVTHRPTLVSIYSSQGLSQQLSNLQIRRAFKETQPCTLPCKGNFLINGGTEFNTR